MGFMVAGAMGMAPFLGKLEVPGFSALLELFPEDIKRTLIPASALLMGVVAVVVQFSPGELQARFRLVMIVIITGLILLIVLDRMFVVEVPMGDWNRLVVRGWSRLAHCGCGSEEEASDAVCIQGLGEDIGTCWSPRAQEQVKLSLQLSYLLLTGGFGALIGLLASGQKSGTMASTVTAPGRNPATSAAALLPSPAPGEPAVAAAGGTIFISYASEDIGAARQLLTDLRDIGGDVVWFDKSALKPGDNWEQQIRSAVQRCGLFLPLLSANTERRTEGYFRLEWNEGAERSKKIQGRKFIFPIVIDSDYHDSMERYALVPERFKAVHYSHAPAGQMNEALRAEIREQLLVLRRARTV